MCIRDRSTPSASDIGAQNINTFTQDDDYDDNQVSNTPGATPNRQRVDNTPTGEMQKFDKALLKLMKDEDDDYDSYRNKWGRWQDEVDYEEYEGYDPDDVLNRDDTKTGLGRYKTSGAYGKPQRRTPTLARQSHFPQLEMFPEPDDLERDKRSPNPAFQDASGAPTPAEQMQADAEVRRDTPTGSKRGIGARPISASMEKALLKLMKDGGK